MPGLLFISAIWKKSFVSQDNVLQCIFTKPKTILRVKCMFEVLPLNRSWVKGKINICDVLHDLVSFVQYKKREKHPLRRVSFS